MSESDIEITSVEEPTRTQADSPDLEIIAEQEELSIDEELARMGRQINEQIKQNEFELDAQQQQNTSNVNAEVVSTQHTQNPEINTQNIVTTADADSQGQTATVTPRLETNRSDQSESERSSTCEHRNCRSL